MLVGEFLERVRKGETVTAIGEQLGLHRKTLQRRLKKLGYVWDQEQLKWRWKGKEGQEPLNVSLTEMHRSWQPVPGVWVGSQQVNSSCVNAYEVNDEEVGSQDHGAMNLGSYAFTMDEIVGLKEMLNHWRESALAAPKQEIDVVDRVREIKSSPKDKVRKTIVIDQDIAHKLDEFAERKRLNKSDILHLAILDFVEKYRD